MKAYDQLTTVLRPTVKIYEELCKTENADPLKIQGFEGLRRVMSCRGWFPDDEVDRLKNAVIAWGFDPGSRYLRPIYDQLLRTRLIL